MIILFQSCSDLDVVRLSSVLNLSEISSTQNTETDKLKHSIFVIMNCKVESNGCYTENF